MLAPFLLLFIIFTVLPVVLSIILSLTDFNMLQMPHFLGIDNYMRLFLDDEIFILAIQNTLVFAAITGPVSWGRSRSHHKAEITSPSGGAFGNGGRAETAAVFLRVRSAQARSETEEFHGL